jgi:hypothetical protein
MNCSVTWCDQTACSVTGMCRMHTQELDLGDPRLGPLLEIQKSPGDLGPFRNFFLVTDKDGNDQLSEVSEGFYPRVPFQSTGATPVTPET